MSCRHILYYNKVRNNIEFTQAFGNIARNMSKQKKTDKKKNITPAENKIESPVSEDKSGNICINILVKPGAKLNGITDVSPESIGVQVSAPPIDGQCNTELIKYLSSILGLRKSDVSLEKGSRSRQKIIMVTGNALSVEDVIKKFTEEIGK